MLGSILAGFSRTIIQLIIFRALAGAGGGAIVSIGQIVISDVVTLRERCVELQSDEVTFPALMHSTAQRGKYQGIIGVVVAFGFAIGPPHWRCPGGESQLAGECHNPRFEEAYSNRTVVLLGYSPNLVHPPCAQFCSFSR